MGSDSDLSQASTSLALPTLPVSHPSVPLPGPGSGSHPTQILSITLSPSHSSLPIILRPCAFQYQAQALTAPMACPTPQAPPLPAPGSGTQPTQAWTYLTITPNPAQLSLSITFRFQYQAQAFTQPWPCPAPQVGARGMTTRRPAHPIPAPAGIPGLLWPDEAPSSGVVLLGIVRPPADPPRDVMLTATLRSMVPEGWPMRLRCNVPKGTNPPHLPVLLDPGLGSTRRAGPQAGLHSLGIGHLLLHSLESRGQGHVPSIPPGCVV